jgi:hypothetical protein
LRLFKNALLFQEIIDAGTHMFLAHCSSSYNPLSHSRTGSLPAAVRKKISGIFCGCGLSSIKLLLQEVYLKRYIGATPLDFAAGGDIDSYVADPNMPPITHGSISLPVGRERARQYPHPRQLG